jgi:peptidoglycan-N-acetylglucosamine deacetylase
MRVSARRILIITAALLVSLAALFGLWRLSKALCIQPIGEMHCRVETSERLVALTFDDGPTERGVERMLPILERTGAKATFFLVGERIAERPDLASRLVERGHELGNHTYTHRRMLLRWPATYLEEVERTHLLLREAGQDNPNLLRPPYGKRLIGLPLAAARLGYRTIMWDVGDPTEMSDPQAYADAILKEVRPGSIVLMHPMHGQSRVVGEALPIIIGRLQDRGYRLVTVSQLLAAGERN